MSEVNIPFKVWPQARPEHGEVIWFVDQARVWDTYGFSLGTVEYQWDEVDEEGFLTGCSFTYTPGEPTPEGTRLVVCVDGFGWPEDGAPSFGPQLPR